MRLEKIVLDGFKSFADKTEFAFDSSITGIVGPNGCGKSNIVDAVKWVLGEQSLKSLRSDQMADVIFGGSGGRKPLGSAEVSLLISNRDGSGTGRLPIDADQVQISRRVYKSGESDYRLNGKICRLKDIRELFMDTGVGTKAYSIIEQGQIEQLVSASKTDRRMVFEEAAGISKYKVHKKEALRKLERTEQNLLRLADILGEVQKQLRSVKLQAGKARSYLQYVQRLKELQVTYSLVEYAKNDAELKEKKGALANLQEQLAQVAAELARNDTLMSKLGEDRIEAEHKLSRIDNSLVSIQSKIDQQLQRIEFLRARIEELRQRKATAGQRIESLQEQENALAEDLSAKKSELENCEGVLKEKSRAADEVQEALRQISARCLSLEAELEDNKSGIIDIVRRTAQLHNEIQSTSVYRNNLATQKDRLAGRAENANAELEKQLTEKAQYKARLDDIEKVLGELHQSLDSKRRQIEDFDTVLAADGSRLGHSKETRSTLTGELTILADMEKRYEGLSAGAKAVLQKRLMESGDPGYIEGILAEVIATDCEYASAVEAALEGKTDAVVISSATKLLADSRLTSELDGRVTFVCSYNVVEPFEEVKDFSSLPCVKGRIIDLVRYDSKYAPLVWKLLGKTIVVDSVDAAVALAKNTPAGYRFVTLKGELVSEDGTIILGPLVKASGLISRKSRLRQLQETIDNITFEVGSLEHEIERNNQAKTHLEKLCGDLRTAVYEANTEKMQATSKLAVVEQGVKQLSQEQPLIVGEIGLLEEQIAESVQKEYDSKQKLQELEAVNEQRSARIKELETKYAEGKTQQQSQMDLLTDLKVAIGQTTEQAKALKQIIVSLESQMQANRIAAETAQAEIQTCGQHLAEAETDILNCEAAVSELFVQKEGNQKSSKLLYEEIERLAAEQKRIEEVLRLKDAEKTQIEQQIGELKIELSQLELKRQNLVEKVQQELQIDLAEAYKNYTAQQACPERSRRVDWDRIREEIADLRGKIERLGNVNVDAIAEQEGLEKRHEFLSSQVEDLNKSKAQLQQLISRLNKNSREKFSETFGQIRVHFQQIFRKLFGGGRADIVLEDSEDILEAGIEVIARPPGKETRSISLLSGGEKSMTAIALLFAIFKTKPSPFCFLDEIDAALDEANNERFNLLLREFVKDSQFIIITHAKRTMSIAEELFGITMQTQGVSKKISVRFDQYEVEPETAAVA
jgi:chromosome segregation protein